MIPVVTYPSPLLPLLTYLLAYRISPMNLKHVMAFTTTNTAFVLNLLVNVYAFVDLSTSQPKPNSIVEAVDVLGGISIFFPFLQNKASLAGGKSSLYFNHVFTLLQTAFLAAQATLTADDVIMLSHLLQQLPVELRSLELWDIVRQWLGAQVSAPVREAMVLHLLVNGELWSDAEVHAQVCEWICLALQNPDVSTWLRCCPFQQVQHEMRSDRVISAWCAEQSSLIDSEIRLLFALPPSEVIVAVFEQWAMNESSCKRMCSVLNDGCIAWAMEQGATLEEGLKYNLMWVMKDVLDVYEEPKRWSLMTESITPWQTTDVVLTRMLELEQYYWLPFVAASISHTPAVLPALLASLEKYMDKMIVHPNWYKTFIPLLENPSVYSVLTAFLAATVREHAQGKLTYDITIAWLGLFTSLDDKYGHEQAVNSVMVDVWIALCEAYKTIIPQCESTMVWDAFGRTLDYLLQMMYFLLDEEETHFVTNWRMLHVYISLISLVAAPSTRITLQALLVKCCRLLQHAGNRVVMKTADGKQSPVAELDEKEDEEDLLSFGAPSKPEPEPEPEQEQKQEQELTEEEKKALEEQSVDFSEIEDDIKIILRQGLGGDLRLAAEAARCMLPIPCLRSLVSMLLGMCDERIRAMLMEAETKLKKRWNVDRKKDEALIAVCRLLDVIVENEV